MRSLERLPIKSLLWIMWVDSSVQNIDLLFIILSGFLFSFRCYKIETDSDLEQAVVVDTVGCSVSDLGRLHLLQSGIRPNNNELLAFPFSLPIVCLVDASYY
jgi:hypothetical protein